MMKSNETNARNERMIAKTSERASSEIARTAGALRSRADYSREYDYFLGLAENITPDAAEERSGRRALLLLCVQAPLELIHAAGFHPFKAPGGSNAACGLASQGLPALSCPMLRSVIGSSKLDERGAARPWVLPATCDWVVKFPEMLELAGAQSAPLAHWLELPHLKDGEQGQERWMEEIYALKKFLELHGARVNRASLSESAKIYQRAWRALVRLAVLRECGRLPSVWFMLMAGTFFCDSPQNWTDAANLVPGSAAPSSGKPKIFLAGSPVFFPDFKLPFLLEEAGLETAADDLCSSERIFPGCVAIDDESEFGILSALAQRYHQGCVCPTFIDNDRRINNILGRREIAGFGGVVFHVLKGCHPYDLESFGLEAKLKGRGLKFIRLETDYSAEDSQNLSTRLEAFRRTLEHGVG